MSDSLALHRPDLLINASLINGQWVRPNEGVAVRNPSSGTALATIPDVGAAGATQAIEAAQTAFDTWKLVVPKERGKLLNRWAQLMLTHTDDLAAIITAEQGKPLREAKNEVIYAASFVEWFAAQAQRADGDIIAATKPEHRIMVLKQPIGVVAAITPWNFPAAMVTRKIAPALAAGCSVVLKPAEQTPLTAFALGQLALEAGIPAGVINIISGKASVIGKILCDDARVRKLSFTGSTEVGRLLYQQCAPTVKKLALELGGNAPFIIFDDADLDQAIKGLMGSKFRNNGQTCVCANRILVQKSILPQLLAKLTPTIAALRCGDGTDESCDLGPLIDTAAREKVESLLADALAKGATLHTGGKAHALGGTFFEATLISGVTPQMRLFREEIFGPVVAITTFEDEAEAIALANDTEYGLAAYFYTQNYKRIWRVSEALDYGMVGANEGMMSTEVAPFGGMKQSGLGREGSKYGIEEYLEKKYVCWGDVR